MIKHEKAKGLTHSSFHSLACCPQAVTPWHPGQRERGGQTAASCNESLAPRPSSPGSPGPSFRQGIMSAWPPCLLSQKKPSWPGGGLLLQKAAATKRRRAAPSKTEEQGFLLSGWMGTHGCKCSAQTPLKKCEVGHLSKLQEILEEGSDTESDLKETLYAPLMQYLFWGLISIKSLPGCPFPSRYPQCDR